MPIHRNEGVVPIHRDERVVPIHRDEGVVPIHQDEGVLPIHQDEGVVPIHQTRECYDQQPSNIIKKPTLSPSRTQCALALARVLSILTQSR